MNMMILVLDREAQFKWVFKTTFLTDVLEEEVCMQQPQLFVQSGNTIFYKSLKRHYMVSSRLLELIM
jgi:hypothetical protein